MFLFLVNYVFFCWYLFLFFSSCTSLCLKTQSDWSVKEKKIAIKLTSYLHAIGTHDCLNHMIKCISTTLKCHTYLLVYLYCSMTYISNYSKFSHCMGVWLSFAFFMTKYFPFVLTFLTRFYSRHPCFFNRKHLKSQWHVLRLHHGCKKKETLTVNNI